MAHTDPASSPRSSLHHDKVSRLLTTKMPPSLAVAVEAVDDENAPSAAAATPAARALRSEIGAARATAAALAPPRRAPTPGAWLGASSRSLLLRVRRGGERGIGGGELELCRRRGDDEVVVGRPELRWWGVT